MKRFLFLLIAALSFAVTASAQTSKNLWLKNYDNTVLQYGVQSTVTTTSATPATLYTVAVPANEGGVLEVQLVGFSNTDSSVVTGSKIVRYAKKGGTLTLGTATSVLATAADTGISGATWAITTSSNNVIVQVTGVANYSITWKAVIRRLYLRP